MLQELFGGDRGVEGMSVAEIAISQFIDVMADDFGGGAFGGFIRGKSQG